MDDSLPGPHESLRDRFGLYFDEYLHNVRFAHSGLKPHGPDVELLYESVAFQAACLQRRRPTISP